MLSPLEDRYVALHRELHALAKQAAQAKKELIHSFLGERYPGLSYTLTIADDNILAVDLDFPDLDERTTQAIFDHVMLYLNRLLWE